MGALRTVWSVLPRVPVLPPRSGGSGDVDTVTGMVQSKEPPSLVLDGCPRRRVVQTVLRLLAPTGDVTKVAVQADAARTLDDEVDAVVRPVVRGPVAGPRVAGHGVGLETTVVAVGATPESEVVGPRVRPTASNRRLEDESRLAREDTGNDLSVGEMPEGLDTAGPTGVAPYLYGAARRSVPCSKT